MLSERLSDLGVDISISSLGKFEGQPAFVVGAEYPDETASASVDPYGNISALAHDNPQWECLIQHRFSGNQIFAMAKNWQNMVSDAD